MLTLQNRTSTEFLSVLPDASRAAALAIEAGGGDLLLFGQSLAASPITGIAPKGPSIWPKDLWPKIVQELRTLVCTDDTQYAETRKELAGEKPVPARMVTAVIAAAVSAKLGLEAGVCVPFVAILLAAIVRVGVAGWCAAGAESPPSEGAGGASS